MTISVLLADDEHLVRAGLHALIQAEPDLTVVGEADNGADAVSLARSLRPDVVLMDVRMPGRDGIEATAEILTTVPQPPASSSSPPSRTMTTYTPRCARGPAASC